MTPKNMFMWSRSCEMIPRSLIPRLPRSGRAHLDATKIQIRECYRL